MTVQASKRLLRGRAKVAIENVTGGEIDGMCDPICVEFCRLVEQLGYKTEGIARVRFLGIEPHYVAVIRGGNVEFTDAEYILVDPTIQQFADLLQGTPEIVIIDSDDSRWEEWYPDLELIMDKRVEAFREEL